MHWLVAILIIIAFGIAFYMDDLPFSLDKIKLINYHKWLGFMVLIFFIPRVLSSVYGYSKIISNNLEDKIANLTHKLLYLAMFLTPLFGWLMSSAKGFPIVLFGIIPVPDLISPNKELGHLLGETHEVIAFSLLALLIVHISGAIFRQCIKKDSVITNMIK
jgi:cytochrome b561